MKSHPASLWSPYSCCPFLRASAHLDPLMLLTGGSRGQLPGSEAGELQFAHQDEDVQQNAQEGHEIACMASKMVGKMVK